MRNPGVTVRGLRKVFASGEGHAGGIRKASFDLSEGTFFTLLGPSGCGKTTTLRCIAGLEQPDEGLIQVGDTVFFDTARDISVPLNRRGIGMVFQSYAIWPHMTVFQNVSFPLRAAKGRSYGRAEVEALTRKALATVGLDQFADRSATRLSGGQQQRVALARAIVCEPRLLLLDEPLSNLDAALRESMRQELKRLQRQIGITTIYVTHDQAEAFEMSDRIAILDDGHIVQIGSPEEIYFHPANRFVATFVGSTNLLQGVTAGPVKKGELVTVRLANGDLLPCISTREAAGEERVTVSIRPEAIRLASSGAESEAGAGRLTGQVTGHSFLGSMGRFEITTGSERIIVNSEPRRRAALGEPVCVVFRPEDAILLADGAPP